MQLQWATCVMAAIASFILSLFTIATVCEDVQVRDRSEQFFDYFCTLFQYLKD